MRKFEILVRKLVPQFILRRVKMVLYGTAEELRLVRAFVSDYFRYRKHSYSYYTQNDGSRHLAAMIILDAHCLEKGFSLPDIRSGYGVATIRRLTKLLNQYQQRGYDKEGLAYQKAKSVLAEYIRYHEKIEYDLGAFKEEILPWTNMACGIGGYMQLTRDELLKRAHGDFKECALSRYSIRSYAPNPVDEETISEVLEIARKTPSVCNRQTWHTYIIKDPQLKTGVLELQNGNRGFGNQADFIIVITTDISSFAGARERNETYVDGGLFSMSILYALHYKGIGACPLNWMVEPSQDRKLRALLKINPSENIIMIITAGNIPETVRVSKSARKGVKTIMTVMNSDPAENDGTTGEQ